jgi:hypothetical protein
MIQHDKNTTEHEVLDALALPECAICALNRRCMDGWVDSLLREGVTNIGSRLRFREAGGLCGDHSRLLEERGNPLGVAILMYDLFTEASPAQIGKRAAVRCEACHFLRETEARYVDALAGALVWTESRERFAASQGLCIPHVRRLLRRARRPAETWVRMACATHLEPLTAELAEIIRKNDYRFRGEEWGPEADAWKRALARWSGSCVAEEG